jgi:cyclopropane fatty-acyl-phospholipid synthase-like methyltransferase
MRSHRRNHGGFMPELVKQDGIVFRDPSLKRRYQGRKIPMNTFFEAFIAEKIDVEGDLYQLLRHRENFVNYNVTWEQVKFLVGSFIPSLLFHTKVADHRFVTEHYDRGNDFFQAFLGESMVYTSAFFDDLSDSLEQAQMRKIRYVGEKLHLKEGERLLDIGCGWGTLVLELAAEFGVDATGVTISKNQAEFAQGRIKARKLEQQARILTIDYRDIPAQRFDKISVLEMAEHVGIRNFQKFLRQVHGLLDDDGVFFLQIVGKRQETDMHDFTWLAFMSKYIFPGADASLPLAYVTSQLEKAGFEVHSVENINVHYGHTIHRWYQNWVKNRDQVVKTYGEWWYRLWYMFLAWSSEVGEMGRCGCYQIVCNKARLGFDRDQYIGEPVALGEHAAEPAQVPARKSA